MLSMYIRFFATKLLRIEQLCAHCNIISIVYIVCKFTLYNPCSVYITCVHVYMSWPIVLNSHVHTCTCKGPYTKCSCGNTVQSGY